jgi:hypothetical protein
LLQEWDVLAEVTVPSPAAATADADSSPSLLSATLTWRGDSKYFATNTLWSTTDSSSSSGACRLLHIWDREDCQLHSTAQAAAGLAAPIAWQPNSRHLYAAAAVAQDTQQNAAASAGFDSRGHPLKAAPHQQPGFPSWPAVEAAAAAAAAGGSVTPQQQQQQASSVVDAAGGSWLQHVLLYECNGLQHGGFDVPTFSQTSSSSSSSNGLVIHALHWSSDSELLAVVLAPAGAGQQRAAAAGAAGDSSCATHEWHVQVRGHRFGVKLVSETCRTYNCCWMWAADKVMSCILASVASTASCIRFSLTPSGLRGVLVLLSLLLAAAVAP